jgi:Leucine-rich repeat (LRR) protein
LVATKQANVLIVVIYKNDNDNNPNVNSMMNTQPYSDDEEHEVTDRDQEESDGMIHDQLPTVEEIKAKVFLDSEKQQRQHEQRKKQWTLWSGVVGLCILSLTIFIIVGTKRHRYHKAIASITKHVRISHPDVFEDATSPQSRALQWMVNYDPLHLPLPKHPTDPFVQRYIIATFVYAITPPENHNNAVRDMFHFLSYKHECLWNSQWKRTDADHSIDTIKMGIICENPHPGSHVDRHEDDDATIGFEHPPVTSIVVQSAGLRGELPPEMEFLTSLRHVALDGNQIKGQIPVMPYLTHLSVSYNALTGYVPDYFSEMTRLEVLSMSENALQGSLPTTLAGLTNLKLLALNGNELTGGLAQIYPLTSLEELYLQYNSFEDQLSNGSFRSLANLKVLDMKSNRFYGPLPDALWNLSKLEVIDFHHNSLDGHINDVIISNHPLKYLDISSNVLGGGLPPSTSNLRSLTHLDVSYNRFEATLPSHLANATRMKTLLMTENDMFGPQPIPDWIRNMKDLRHLSFRLTSRTGTIPAWFGELTNLELLDLDWNHLSGTIPTELAQLSHLKYLMLNRNIMHGKIPRAVSSLQTLEVLMVDSNDFNGALESCHIPFLIADCGDPEKGCPDCDSDTQQISCPCCTSCCYDNALRCNMEDWIGRADGEFRNTYDRYGYNFDKATYFPVID